MGKAVPEKVPVAHATINNDQKPEKSGAIQKEIVESAVASNTSQLGCSQRDRKPTNSPATLPDRAIHPMINPISVLVKLISAM